MMRVGTQKRSKSSSSPSPNSTYRQSPTSRYSSSSPSPINHVKNSTYNNYRQSASPVLNETHKYAQEYHKMSLADKRNSPSFNDRTSSPSYLNRTNSPSYMQRTQSPSYNRSDSPDYISSRRLNEKRYDTASPNFAKKAEYDSNYTSKMSSMRISDSRSPNFLERSSPDVGYNSRYDKRVTESRSYNSSYDQNDGIDTSPIVKVSALTDNSSARRDSWDAIAKTRNMLSERSLESVANLTESQLDADMRRKKVEEHNRVFSQEHSYTASQKYSNNVDIYGERDKYGRQSPSGYRTGVRSGGAASVKVQPVPDGVLGQPVEFESTTWLIM